MKGNYTKIIAGLALLIFLGVSASAWAQSPQVEEIEVEVNGITRKGQRIMVPSDSKAVEKAWASYLKEKSGGAVKGPSLLPTPKALASKGIYTVESGKMDTISSKPLRIVSKVEAAQGGTMVWWSLDMGNAYVSKKETAQEWARAEALLQQFARSMYLQDIQQQVADAEKVVVNSQLEEDRVVRQANEIQTRIAKNHQRKLELEAALVANAQELEQLNKEVETNLKQQEAARLQVQNMRRAVELVKAKADKVK
ncbi:DNA repair ATPase [Rufibacter immobilis]|uniref:DNA repair ATPase n=1 Tax=Rufibacter immobilis TaxID=1348778 RepID=A0A3M9N6X3_9BACT|nr:DNA repair ATPase [Rufibacter immobilis]RNI32963.1 DNA repair ATPase [Rufibacter immobilis]